MSMCLLKKVIQMSLNTRDQIEVLKENMEFTISEYKTEYRFMFVLLIMTIISPCVLYYFEFIHPLPRNNFTVYSMYCTLSFVLTRGFFRVRKLRNQMEEAKVEYVFMEIQKGG